MNNLNNESSVTLNNYAQPFDPVQPTYAYGLDEPGFNLDPPKPDSCRSSADAIYLSSTLPVRKNSDT